MGTAEVASLYIGPVEGGPIDEVEAVTAVAGAGIEGDRYWQGEVPEDKRDPSDEITLFAKEAVDGANERTGLDITYKDMRRNVLTEGVDLDGLVGKRFFVGDVELEGIKPNPPCAHLQKLAGKPLLKAIIDGGGLRARIVTSGTIKRGDAIRTDA